MILAEHNDDSTEDQLARLSDRQRAEITRLRFVIKRQLWALEAYRRVAKKWQTFRRRAA